MTKPYWLAPVVAVAFIMASPAYADGVRNNGGNCVGVKSCRPRCVTFRVERTLQECQAKRGIFAEQTDVNPWDIKRFGVANCEASGEDLTGDITIRIGEEGHSGSLFSSTMFLAEGEDRFTYCSLYPCPKDECALPEQLGLGLRFDFLRGSVGLNGGGDSFLTVSMFLKAAFVGSPIYHNEENRYGPLHVEWMDDPAGCREGEFSSFVPVAPDYFPEYKTNTTILPPSLYCSGSEYAALPLPQTQAPTSMPSSAPSSSPVPTAEATYSAVGLEQLEALEVLYNATEMGSDLSRARHNWFSIADYCNFTGVTCNIRGYVTAIDLTGKRLAGSLPTELSKLSFLNTFRLVNNNIGGPIPTQLSQLSKLTLVELSSNLLSGEIPEELSSLSQLRRLMLQYNNLNGTIPSELCNLYHLKAFGISGNEGMFGEIPSCFGILPLEVLRVEDVGLVGEVPSGLCGVRPFNGMSENTFNCSGIACPAGTYEPTIGRQNSLETQCITCPSESNVIGSTTCMVVDGNEVVTNFPTFTPMPSSTYSESPSTPSTTFPSVLPSAAPSPAPSKVASQTPQPTIFNATTAPSQTPSETPSTFPSVSPSGVPSGVPSAEVVVASEPPSQNPSKSPSAPPTVLPRTTLRVSVMFPHVSRVMTNVSDIETFEEVTFQYLHLHDTVAVYNTQVLSQSLRVPHNETPAVVVVESNQRRLEQEVLFVQLQVDGERSDFFEDDVVALLESENYTKALAQELELFEETQIPDEGQPLPEPDPPTAGKKGSENVNWWLLSASVTLSVIAIASVFIVRRMRIRDRRAAEAHFFEQEQRAHDSVHSPPIHTQDSAPMSPPSYHTHADAMSSPASYYQYSMNSAGEGSLSEESSGGWKSEDDSDDDIDDGHFVNQGDADASMAGWSYNNELCLMSKAPDETLV